jgi:hypothetical protein
VSSQFASTREESGRGCGGLEGEAHPGVGGVEHGLGEVAGATGRSEEQRRRAPVAGEEDGDLGVDSARLVEGLGVQEEEDDAAVPFLQLDGLGEVPRRGPARAAPGSPWRRGGGSRERRRGKTAAGKRELGFGGVVVELIKAGERAAVSRGRRSGSSVSVRRQRGGTEERRKKTPSGRTGTGLAGPSEGVLGRGDYGQKRENGPKPPAA